MRKNFYMLITMLTLLIIVGCSTNHQKIESPIEISAELLWQTFEENRSDAEAEYNGEIVSVTGEIVEISDSFMGSPCILLENGVDSIPDGIFCFLPNDMSDRLADFSVGETITVVGTLSLGIHIAGEDTPFIFIYADTLDLQ